MNHDKVISILNWGFPGTLDRAQKWDGVKSLQSFLDDDVTWVGSPVTASQIEAKEADYDAHIASIASAKDAVQYIEDRKVGYIAQTMAAKSYDGDPIDGLGFWIDAIMTWAEQEIDAGRLQTTPEMDALFSIRSTVKTTYPKPE